MSRATKGLLAGEEIIYSAKLHWNVYILPYLLMIFMSFPAMFGYFHFHFRGNVIFIVLACIPVFLLFISFLERNTSEFVVTNMRVVVFVGILSSRSIEIMLSKIESITVDQELAGKFLNFGSLTVNGTGGTKEMFNNIQNPFEFRKRVGEQLVKIAT